MSASTQRRAATVATGSAPQGMASEVLGQRMADYAFACDSVAGRLTAAERTALQDDGSLPPWFLPAVDEQVARRRAQLRR